MKRSGLATASMWPLGFALAVVLAAGTAEGQTGWTWTKYEGNPVLEHGTPGEWDAVIDHQEVIFDGVMYHMWYAGGLALHETDIGYATSTDGVTWTKYAGNPVLLRGAPGEWDAGSLQPGAVIWDGALYHMWYGAGAVPGGAGLWYTGYATSPDGATWTKHPDNPVFQVGDPGGWDTGAGIITAVIDDGGTYRAWYWGLQTWDWVSIGYATSPDGVHWEKWPEPVLEPRSPSWEWNAVAFPMVVQDGGAYHMWYSAGNCAGFGHAVSADGINWERQPLSGPVLPCGGSGEWDWCAFSSRLVLEGDTAHMWYNGVSAQEVSAIGYATATLPVSDDRESFIPAAAVAAGAQGAFFQTDLEINNKGTDEAQVTLQWLPRGQDNSEPLESDAITLAPGQSLRYENVLNALFGLEPDSVGAIRLVSNKDNVIGMSRTYNVPGAKIAGTFGQGLPAIPSDQLIPSAQVKRIIFMSENDDIRANLGCVNGLDTPLRIDIEIHDSAGTLLEFTTMNLGPWSNKQINRIFQAYAPVDGYVDVSTQTEGAAFYCYGSVLDNSTSDPTTVLPQTTSGATIFVPAAALAAGLQGAFFQTDIDLNNAGGTPAQYELGWLPRGADNSDPTMSDPFTLAAGASVRYENVLAEIFGLEPDQVGALVMEADSEDLLAMSRTYNVPGAKIAGTFGQELPGVPADQMIPTGVKKRIIFMNENDDVRSNVGCQNAGLEPVTVKIELHNADGERLGTRTMELPPLSNDQATRVFRNHAPISAGYVDVWTDTEGASIYCYGSALDNLTSDPTTVLPQ